MRMFSKRHFYRFAKPLIGLVAFTLVASTIIGINFFASLEKTSAFSYFVKNIGTVTGNGPTLQVTIPAVGVTSGNSLIIALSIGVKSSFLQSPSCSDDGGGGNTYSLDIANTVSGGTYLGIFSSHNVAALTSGKKITCIFSAVTTGASMSVNEFSGLASSSTKDQIAMNTCGTNCSSPFTSGTTPNTTQANELLFAAIGRNNTTTTSPFIGAGVMSSLVPEYQIVSSIGAYQASWTGTSSNTWRAAIVTYKIITDTTAPIITITSNDDAHNLLKVGDLEFVDPGATATDNYDGDLTSSIIATGTVNTGIAATYPITYNATDSSGNSASTTRNVVVRNLGTDVSLSDLSISVGNLNPTFVSSTLDYTVILPYGASTTPDTYATSTDLYACVIITPAVNITSTTASDRITTITVTAEDGVTIKIYTILFNEPAPIISEKAAAPQSNGTSITVTWTTDHLATSRVVYDIVSSTLGVAPNYGYANSTVEDFTLVTDHSVVISDLIPATTYYFRSISRGSPITVSEEFSATTGNIPLSAPVTTGNTYGGGSYSGIATIIQTTTTQTEENTSENLIENEVQTTSGSTEAPAIEDEQGEVTEGATATEQSEKLAMNVSSIIINPQPSLLATILSTTKGKVSLGIEFVLLCLFIASLVLYRKNRRR